MQQVFPGGSDLQLFSVAINQPAIQFLLQSGQGMADGGLRQKQFLPRERKTTGAGYGDKREQLPAVHRLSVKWVNRIHSMPCRNSRAIHPQLQHSSGTGILPMRTD